MSTRQSAKQPTTAGGIDALHAQIRELVRTHHRSLLNQVDRLGEMLVAPEAHCVGAITEAEFLAHQIKGAAGSLGFGSVNAAATRTDKQLKSFKVQGRDATADEMKRVRASFKDLRRAAQATTPEPSSLWNTKPIGLSHSDFDSF